MLVWRRGESPVEESVELQCIAWVVVNWRKIGLPTKMAEMHDLSTQDLHDARVHADLKKLVETAEVVDLYQDYKSLKTDMAEASRIFQCFKDEGCSKELVELEKEATTFVDCLVVAQVAWSAEKQSKQKRLQRLQKAKTVAQNLPASWAAALQEEIDGIDLTAEPED